jgi:hypothetical protein
LVEAVSYKIQKRRNGKVFSSAAEKSAARGKNPGRLEKPRVPEVRLSEAKTPDSQGQGQIIFDKHQPFLVHHRQKIAESPF